MAAAEIEKPVRPKQEAIPRPETLPEKIEQDRVKRTPVQPQVVYDDQGKPITQTPATSQVTIQLPTDVRSLTNWVKAPVTNSLRWLAAFWLRMIKKAKHFGWRIIQKGGN